MHNDSRGATQALDAVKRAKHREIAIRYSWHAKRQSDDRPRAPVRVRDLLRLLHLRHGKPLPDPVVMARSDARGPAGYVELAKVILHHQAHAPDATSRMSQFRNTYCQWVSDAEIEKIIAHRRKWSASELGTLLSVTPREREFLRITTIGWRGSTTTERKTASLRARRKREAVALRIKRNRTPREEWLSQGLSRQKPWAAYGITRRTWERWRQSGWSPGTPRPKGRKRRRNVASVSVPISVPLGDDTLATNNAVGAPGDQERHIATARPHIRPRRQEREKAA